MRPSISLNPRSGPDLVVAVLVAAQTKFCSLVTVTIVRAEAPRGAGEPLGASRRESRYARKKAPIRTRPERRKYRFVRPPKTRGTRPGGPRCRPAVPRSGWASPRRWSGNPRSRLPAERFQRLGVHLPAAGDEPDREEDPRDRLRGDVGGRDLVVAREQVGGEDRFVAAGRAARPPLSRP